jgi:hypothetical protein
MRKEEMREILRKTKKCSICTPTFLQQANKNVVEISSRNIFFDLTVD